MKHFILIVLFILSTSLSIFGQTDSLHKVRPSLVLQQNQIQLSPGKRWATISMFIPASIIMINNHEIGHTLLAKLSGDASAHFYFYHNNSLGFNIYDHTRLSRSENAIVPLGGVVFSQVLAQLSDQALKNISMKPFLQRATAMIYIMTKFDLSFQVLQGIVKANKFNFIKRYNRPSRTDMVDFAYYFSNGNHNKFIWINIGMIAITALDIYLSRHQITRNWHILFNKRRYAGQFKTQ